MKRRSTTPARRKSFATRTTLVVVALVMALTPTIQFSSTARADEFDERIQAIQREIDQYQAKASQLQAQTDSLQKEVSALEAQKAIIQGQINLKQAEHDKLIADIKANEDKIATGQDVLGTTIADIYIDDNISPLEMLASSKSIGEFVDKQEYRSSVRDQLVVTIDKVRQLKKSLEEQKSDVERVLAEQKFARDELSRKQAQQQTLIAQTRGQEAAYQQLSASREQQKLQVQQAQQAAIEAAMRAANRGSSSVNILPGDPNKGGYPWEAGCWVDANAWSHGGAGGDGTDPLGYGCRQCVSYTAYRVGAYNNGDYPRYWGNANMWPASARATGYETGTTPRVNSVGVISAGAYGHVVWVEAVNGDGTIDVSQYNYFNAGGPGWGNYSKMRVSASTYDTYIYF